MRDKQIKEGKNVAGMSGAIGLMCGAMSCLMSAIDVWQLGIAFGVLAAIFLALWIGLDELAERRLRNNKKRDQ